MVGRKELGFWPSSLAVLFTGCVLMDKSLNLAGFLVPNL